MQLTVCGNLTANPVLRQTNGDPPTPVANFVIAVNRKIRGATGESIALPPKFFPCAVYYEQAERVARSLRKGHRVIAVGEINFTTWRDREDVQHKGVELLIAEVGASCRYRDVDVLAREWELAPEDEFDDAIGDGDSRDIAEHALDQP